MRFGSLFSGIGGFDLGFERAGMWSAWQCEIDSKCREVLQKHWEGVQIFDDVRNVTANNASRVDLLCGGFPCQDLSIAGKRAGLAGERSGLWYEFARVIEELRPRWVVIENVPGLLSSWSGDEPEGEESEWEEESDFFTVISKLEKFGYCVSWRILDAQFFGVAQRRRRVFIVGSLGNGNSAKVLFESEGMSGDTPPSRKTGEEVTYATLDNLTAHGKRFGVTHTANTLENQSTSNMAVMTVGSLQVRDYKGINSDNLDHMVTVGALQARDCKGVVAYENHPADSRITETGDISQQLTARMGTGGGNVPLIAWDTIQITSKQNGSIPKEGFVPTLNSGGRMMVGVRRLTPTECARLQGFPDDWNDWLADSTRYKQFGNAVCVNVVEWIGKRIMAVEGES